MNSPTSDRPETSHDSAAIKDRRVLGGWKLEPAFNRLIRNGVEVRLEPRTMQVLTCLIDATGEPVTRATLMQTVWGHEYVTEDALNRAVSRLRRTLAEELGAVAAIETIPKVGYRLRTADATAAHNSAQPESRRRPRRWPWLAAAAGIVFASVAAAYYVNRPAPLFGGGPIRITPLTTLPGSETAPAISPDGNRVAFAWRHSPAAPWRIYVRALDNGTQLKISDGPGDDIDPAWSPDGSRIAFLRRTDGHCELYVVSALGGTPRELGQCNPAFAGAPAWAPSGDALAINAPGRRGLVWFPLDGSAPHALTHPPKVYLGDRDAVFSPDGKQVAFIRERAMDVSDVYVVRTNGGKPRQLTHDNLSISGVTWSANGRYLIFASNRGGLFALWRVSAGGGMPVRLPVSNGNADMPVMSRDGNRLIYGTCTCQINLFALDLKTPTAAPRQLTAVTRWDWRAQASPSGARIAFASDRSGATEIWVSGPDGGNALRLTNFGGPYTGDPAWLPDGKTIVFDTSAVDGNFDIYRIGAAGGKPQRLTTNAAEDRFPHASPDGRWIYFSSRRTGRWETWRIPTAGGAAEQVTRGGAYFAFPAANGTLYFSRAGAAGIWRRAPGQAPQLVVRDLRAGDAIDWTLADGRLWYVQRDAHDKPALAAYTIVSGRSRTIAALPQTLAFDSGISVTPDARLIFANTVRLGADLMLVSRQ